MDLVVSWILFPAFLVAICTGCGLVVELVGGRLFAASVLPVAGLAAVVVLGTGLMVADVTAELAAPGCAALALGGFALAMLRRRPLPRSAWAGVAAIVVFGIYAAPIAASGEATIAGFIKLDDTATWLAFTDQIAAHGRDLDGLALSTYEATLTLNIGEGYPVGAFVPLAVGASLTGMDPAWLVQPFMATLAGMLAMALWALAGALRERPALRCAASVVGAAPALLVGYYLWGGVKEVLAAALLAGVVALSLPALERGASARAILAPVLTAAALIATLSAGGAIWLLPLAAGAGVVLVARRGLGAAAGSLGIAGGLVAVLSLPTLIPGGLRPPTSSPLDDDDALGNLAAPLDPLQLVGIWGEGDFRFQPADEIATYALAVLACLVAAGTVAWAVRRRFVGVPWLVLGVLAGCALLAIAGSPWVEGKAFATASIAIPFAAMVGAGLLVSHGQVLLGGAVALAIAGGVVWSNALAYRDVDLAPRAQLEELERIGELVAGKGPTLITEYSPYGARHFLRDGDPESISELRRRTIPLRDGSQVSKGESADTDRIDPVALAVYRSLVVRRSPAQSRPPMAYELAWSGEHYELWQREEGSPEVVERLGLGSAVDPVAVPACEDVRRLAAAAPPGAQLVAALRDGPTVLPLSRATYPAAWGGGDEADEPRPVTAGSLEATADLARGGEYELWLGGSVRSRVEAKIGDATIGDARHELNNLGGYVSLGTAVLGAGSHTIEVKFEGPGLAPGGDGRPEPIGPLTLSVSGAADARLLTVAPQDAPRRLCGRPSDWIEVDGALGG